MIQQKLRRVGNSFVVTIPREEVERQHLQAGQLVAVQIQPLEVRPRLAPELRAIIDETWAADEAAYRYLGR